MLNFSLRQLEYAVALGRHLNFGEAARSCSVSQPSLSSQIAQLETSLGKKLFERGARGVVPTPFGRDFVERASAVLAKSQELVDLAQAQEEPLVGDIRLGVIPTVSPFVLPRLIPYLAEEHPQARLLLREEKTEDLVQELANGDLDLLLLAIDLDLGHTETISLFNDAFLLALPESHPLVARESLSLSDVPLSELLLLDEGHCLSRQIESVCRFSKDARPGDFRASSLSTLIPMVAQGIGLTLLPELALESELTQTKGLIIRELADDAHRTIGLGIRPDSPRRAEFELFGALICDACAPRE